MSRRVAVVSVASALALCGGWYAGMWAPKSGELSRARAAAAAAVSKQHALAGQVASLQQQQTLLPALRARLATLQQAIPPQPVVDGLIDSLNATSVAAGVTLTALSPSPASAPVASSGDSAQATGPAAIKLTMGATGSYAQLIDFVNRLDALPRLLVVDGLSFGAPDATTGRITLALTARVFTSKTS